MCGCEYLLAASCVRRCKLCVYVGVHQAVAADGMGEGLHLLAATLSVGWLSVVPACALTLWRVGLLRRLGARCSFPLSMCALSMWQLENGSIALVLSVRAGAEAVVRHLIEDKHVSGNVKDGQVVQAPAVPLPHVGSPGVMLP